MRSTAARPMRDRGGEMWGDVGGCGEMWEMWGDGCTPNARQRVTDITNVTAARPMRDRGVGVTLPARRSPRGGKAAGRRRRSSRRTRKDRILGEGRAAHEMEDVRSILPVETARPVGHQALALRRSDLGA